jgi:hypothetical protein
MCMPPMAIVLAMLVMLWLCEACHGSQAALALLAPAAAYTPGGGKPW